MIFSLKRIVVGLVGFLLVYVLLMIGVDFVLSQQKHRLENLLMTEFHVKNVSIGRLYNFPFIFVGARDVTVSFGDRSEIQIDRIRLFYLPSILWKGIEAIYRIEAEKATGHIEINDGIVWKNKFTNASTFRTSEPFVLPVIVVEKSDINLSFFQAFFLRASISNALFESRLVGWKLSYDGHITANDLQGIEYLKGGGSIDISSYGPQWWQTQVHSAFRLSVGGIPLQIFTNFRTDLRLYKNHPLLITNAQEMLQVNFAEESIRYQQTFRLDYKPLEERGIFEHYFSPGDYTLEASWSHEDFFTLVIKGASRQHLFVSISPEQGRVNFSESKGGQGNLRWQASEASLRASGSLHNFVLIPHFLRLGAVFSLDARAEGGRLTINNALVNGGRVGHTSINFWHTNNTIQFASAPHYRARFHGTIGREVHVHYEGRAIQGTVLTRTIGFDGFDLPNMTMATRGVFHINPFGVITIKGSADGLLVKSGQSFTAETDYLITVPSPTNTIVHLSNLFFSQENIRGNASFDVVYPTRRQFFLKMEGKGDFPLIASAPISLSYTGDALYKTGTGTILLQTNISVSFSHTMTDVSASWRISNTSFSVPLLPTQPSLSSTGRIVLKRGRLYHLASRTFATIDGLEYTLRVDGRTSNNLFAVNTFWLGLGRDTLIGDGFVHQTPTSFDAQIGFVRGGGIRVRTTESAWNAVFDLRRTSVLLPPNRRAYTFETVGEIRGEGLDFDGEGRFKISDGVNTLVVRNLIKRNDRIDFQDVEGVWEDWRVTGGGFIETPLRKAGWNLRVSSPDANMFSMNIIGLYEKTGDSASLSYRVPEWLLFQKRQPAFSGGATFTNDDIIFTKQQVYGINGRYSFQTRHLTAEYLFPFMGGNISGEVSENTLNLSSRNRVNLSFLDQWQDIRIRGGIFASLSVTGSMDSPTLDGNIHLQDFSLTLPGVLTRITNQNLVFTLEDEDVVLQRQRLTTSSGTFWVEGAYSVFREGNVFLGLRPENASAVLRLQGDAFSGVVHPEAINLSGTMDSLTLGGVLRVRQARLWMRLSELFQQPAQAPLPIQLAFHVHLDSKVGFQSEIIDVIFSSGSLLRVSGTLGSPLLLGRLTINSGTLRYLAQSFQIAEGTVNFENDLLPSIDVRSRYRHRGVEDIDIYLTFRGKLPTINLVSFYSIPERRQEEIIAYLGLPQMATDTNVAPRTAERLVYTGVGFAEDIFILSPLSARLRQQLGLDMFVLRSTIAQNYSRYLMGDMDSLSWSALLEGSSLAVGRYIFPNVFLEANISLRDATGSNVVILTPVYGFGISYSFQGFEMGWGYRPWEATLPGQPLVYEQKIEINYRRQF